MNLHRLPWWIKWPLRTTLGLGALLLMAAAGAAIWLWVAVPGYDGAVAVHDLDARVQVVRDVNAIPHIFADTMDDAYRALGYVHAQDRLVQMELNRRLGAGRLAEITGDLAVPADRLMRTLGLYRLAEAQYAALDEPTRGAVDAYVAGVNAYLSGAERTLPPELLLLAGEPEPWRPADSLVWGKLMALQLSGNWRTEMLRLRLARSLSADQLADLWPDIPPGHAATLPDLAALVDGGDIDRLAAILDDVLPVASASNEWVVAGAGTASGAPLLANDPHLGFSAPGLWYLARIVTPERTLVGATVPGVPFHILGHNGAIAWGITSTHSDTQDLFIERLDPDMPGRYLTPQGTAEFDRRQETVRVRFRDADEIVTVRTTRHGPVVSDINPGGAELPEDHVLALAFPALQADDRTPTALYRLNHADDWAEFLAAMENFHAPQQNVAYADRGGTIGIVAPGRVPLRAAGIGALPVPGWTGEFDWTGYVPFAELPQARDPARGRIVNANNKLVDGAYPYQLTDDWPPPFRADRIHQLLDARSRHAVEDATEAQLDTYSPPAAMLVPRLLATVAGSASGRSRRAVEMLGAWDYRMDRNHAAPLIYMAWVRALERRLLADELGDQFSAYAASRPLVLMRMLDQRQIWCDDTSTPGAETCADQIAAALTDALETLAERLGPSIDEWRWGDMHRAQFRHSVFGQIPVLGSLFNITVTTDGGPHTLNRGVASLRSGPGLFEHIHGPGYRAVYDLDDLDNSRFIIATGQSDRPLSAHYADLTPIWADGGYLRLSGSREELKSNAIGVLTLSPI